MEPSSPDHTELLWKRQRLDQAVAFTGYAPTPMQEAERRANTARGTHPAGTGPQGQPTTLAPDASASSQGCQQQAACSAEQIAMLQWLSEVHMELQRWLAVLRGLDPVLELIPCEASVLALGVFRRYWEQYPQRTGQYIELVTLAALASSLWVAIKFLVSPGSVPNAIWLASVAGVPAKVIVKLEPEVLRAVDWDVLGVCKSVGLCLPALIEPKQ